MPPRSLPLFKGPTSKGMEGNGRRGEGEEKVKGKEGERWKERFGHPKILVWRPLCNKLTFPSLFIYSFINISDTEVLQRTGEKRDEQTNRKIHEQAK